MACRHEFYNAEANGRLDITSRVTLLAGVRWLQLNDDLEGTLTPADRSQPTWKQTYPYYTYNLFRSVLPLDLPAGITRPSGIQARRTTFMVSKSART